MKRFYAILLLTFSTGIKLFAGPDTSQLLHFDLDNGFPSNNVYSLIQDKLGYLWFATDNGLVKYNGYSFTVFNTTTGMPSNDVYQLVEDKRGRIWVNSMSYQFGYMQNDKYNEIKLKTHDRIFKGYYFADNGTYMFVTYWEYNTYFLAMIKDDLEQIFPLNIPAPNVNRSEGLALMLTYVNKDCILYIITNNNSIYTYDLLRPATKFKKISGPAPDYYSNYFGGGSVLDEKGNIYLYRARGDNILITSTVDGSRRVMPFNSTPGEYIYTVLMNDRIHEKDKNHLVITNFFVYTLDSNFCLVKKDSIASIINTPSQLAYVFNDELNNLWYTTNSAGVWCKLNDYHIFEPDDTLKELVGSKYVGSSKDGGTFWWNKEKAVFNELLSEGTLKNIKLPFKTSIAGATDYSDSIVYLALTAGIYKYNKHTGQVSNVIDKYENVSIKYEHHQKYFITSDTAETIFFGNHFGIHAYKKGEFYTVGANGLHVFKEYDDSLVCHVVTDERLKNLMFDSISRCFIAYNHQKVVVFDPNTDKYSVFNNEYLKNAGLDNILNIEIDKYYNIYLQNDNTIFIYNPLLNKFAEVNGNFNLLNTTFHLYDGYIAIAGKFGIAKAHIKGPLSIGNFSVVPNFKYYNRINDFVINANGDILLNTDKGFYKLKLQDIKFNKGFPDLANPKFFKLVLKNPYERKLVGNDTIVIDQKMEKINLDAINYYGKGAPSFKYFIAGYSKDWQPTDGEMYTGGLSPGKYYHITCMVSDDVWKSRLVHFYVYRSPYWWQTTKWKVIIWIVAGGMIITLLLVVIFITRVVVARGNRKRRALTELELRAVYAQINPHFIFNTLSAAQFFINKKRFDDAYLHVNKFSKLLRAYLKSSQDRYITLDEEVQMLKNYIELQQIRFEEKFEYRLEIENKIPVNSIQIPSLLLQPLVENAINHGLFHREGGGLLILKFLQGAKSDELICIIEDNGIGRKQAEALKKDSTAQRESYGTKLTQQLIDIYREYEHMDIYMEYIDKTEPETGTIVKLTIKNVKYVA